MVDGVFLVDFYIHLCAPRIWFLVGLVDVAFLLSMSSFRYIFCALWQLIGTTQPITHNNGLCEINSYLVKSSK